jgi:hypothetical protein
MRPILVTGAPRSGKTLMRWLLSSHSRVVVTRRAEMWPRFAHGFGNLAQADNLERCLHALLERRQVAWLAPDRDRLRSEFHAGDATYARLFGLVHEQHARRIGKARWGDQSARFESCIDTLLDAYPEATVLHMVRDPRDRHEALLTRRAARPGDLGRSTAVWLRSVATATTGAAQAPGRYLVVRFEDLVTAPMTTASTVCGAMGEPFEAEMLRMDATRRYDAFRTGVGCPLSIEHIGRYRDGLAPQDVAFVQSVAGAEMLRLGYPLDDIRLTGRDRLRRAVRWPLNAASLGARGAPRPVGGRPR